MTRADRISEYVESLQSKLGPAFRGVDASEVAQALSIWRNDASAELNRLCDSGRLVRSGKKPVRFFPASSRVSGGLVSVLEERENLPVQDGDSPPAGGELPSASPRSAGPAVTEEAFSSLIGRFGSLKAQIQAAKAAVLYPPYGLHTLIIGKTGVGKSLFAEEVWKYAAQTRTLEPGGKVPYVVFNCAEYADNPQLLLSQLFGHVKGAFTGANESKTGLVELAEGGILFLDEIHRLPPTGQEMFFMLIDRGCFRRLGDSVDRRAHIMIIGATSEDPESALLMTFKRRMPVLIQIPSLAERSLNERLGLIELFLAKEADRLNCSIAVCGDALRLFAFYKPKANIGDLRNDLQLCCAHGYLSYRTCQLMGEKPERLEITVYDLPQKVYSASEADTSAAAGLSALKQMEVGIVARPGEEPSFESALWAEESVDLYNFVEKQDVSYRAGNVSREDTERRSFSELERFLKETQDRFRKQELVDDGLFWDIVTPSIWRLAGDLLHRASARLQRTYENDIRRALALHLQQFIGRIGSGQIIYNPNARQIRNVYPKEIAFLRDNVADISSSLGADIPEDELCFLSLFLRAPLAVPRSGCVGLVIAAHGKSVASGIAEAVNHILHIDKVRSVDSLFDRSRNSVFEDVCRAVRDADEGKGVLLLVDMGSFVHMREDVRAETGVPLMALQNVSTPLALEAARVVLSTDLSLEEVYARISDSMERYYGTLTDSAVTIESDRSSFPHPAGNEGVHGRRENRPVILVVCATGIGSAVKIKGIIEERLPSDLGVEIETMGALEDLSSFAALKGTALRLVIGTIDPGLPGVPFLSAESVLSLKGLSRIERLIRAFPVGNIETRGREEEPSRKDLGYDDGDFMSLFKEKIGYFVTSLPGEKVFEQVKFVVERLEEDVYSRRFAQDELVRICMHMAALFDRVARGEIAERHEKYAGERARVPALFDKISGVLDSACGPLGFSFPESELYYFFMSLPSDLGFSPS